MLAARRMGEPANSAHAYWATGPLEGEIRAETLRPAGPGEALVRTIASGISRGTEALVATGRIPTSERERMRCPFQAGDFPFPVKYGYAAVGVVEAGPPELMGRPVFCLHPHQTRFVVPAEALAPIPDNVPPGRAVLAANLETALNAVWDAGALPGDRITVIGAGVVGCLVAWLAGRLPGAEVTLVDVGSGKAAIAGVLGVAFAAPADAPGEADLVIEASGSPAALAAALDLAGFEATVLAVGWYGDAAASLKLGGSFHSRRLRLVSSQVGHVASRQRPRWTYARRMAKVMQLLAEPALDRLISGESPFERVPELMRRLATAPGGTLCHRITYQAG